MRILPVTVALTLALAAPTLHANTVTFSLVSPVQYGSSSITFDGTISVSADSTQAYTVEGYGTNFLPYNSDRYGTGTPYFLLAPNIPHVFLPGETYTGPYFTIGFSSYNPSYSGVFTVYGYFGPRTPDFDPSTPITTTTFTVINGTAPVVTAATPEPSSLLFLGTATAALLGVGWRRFRFAHHP